MELYWFTLVNSSQIPLKPSCSTDLIDIKENNTSHLWYQLIYSSIIIINIIIPKNTKSYSWVHTLFRMGQQPSVGQSLLYPGFVIILRYTQLSRTPLNQLFRHHIQWEYWKVFSGEKWLERGGNHWCPSNVQVKNWWSFSPTPLYLNRLFLNHWTSVFPLTKIKYQQ